MSYSAYQKKDYTHTNFSAETALLAAFLNLSADAARKSSLFMQNHTLHISRV